MFIIFCMSSLLVVAIVYTLRKKGAIENQNRFVGCPDRRTL